ncbi:MAG: cell division protein ZapA [Thalassobaculales bacterium]
MASVNVVINERTYRIACEDGQEQRLVKLAALVDARVAELVRQVGQVGDNRLLVMASLLLADELEDTRAEADQGQAGLHEAVARTIDNLTGRIERLAARLEAP